MFARGATAMADDHQIFDFERDCAGTLRRIPMIVRFKLDDRRLVGGEFDIGRRIPISRAPAHLIRLTKQ
jgi:hypothetical protein